MLLWLKTLLPSSESVLGPVQAKVRVQRALQVALGEDMRAAEAQALQAGLVFSLSYTQHPITHTPSWPEDTLRRWSVPSSLPPPECVESGFEGS